MDGIPSLAKIMVFVGIVIAVLGALMLLLARIAGGRGAPLPGDIVVHRDHFTFYFPIITSVVISAILTLTLWLIAAFRK